jgi:hypothetical protein
MHWKPILEILILIRKPGCRQSLCCRCNAIDPHQVRSEPTNYSVQPLKALHRPFSTSIDLLRACRRVARHHGWVCCRGVRSRSTAGHSSPGLQPHSLPVPLQDLSAIKTRISDSNSYLSTHISASLGRSQNCSMACESSRKRLLPRPFQLLRAGQGQQGVAVAAP